MKKKTLGIAILGITILGALTVVYGANRKNKNTVPNNAVQINNNTSNSQNITAEKAKSIALAQVLGANESNIKEFDFDNENGRMVYEIEIFYNNSKYEYDIDASTGEIIGTEVKHYNKNY